MTLTETLFELLKHTHIPIKAGEDVDIEKVLNHLESVSVINPEQRIEVLEAIA